MPTTRRALRRSLLIAILLAAGGCSKLDKVFGDPPGARLPDTPFSLDCRLHRSFVGSSNPEQGENPAWLRIQINPKGGFYKIIEYGGSLPDYEKIYPTTDSYKNNNHLHKDVKAFGQGRDIPFVSYYYAEGTRPFRLSSTNPRVVILIEYNEFSFPNPPVGFEGSAIPYMRLDVKERTLTIDYEWRDSYKTYADYQRHDGGGPAFFEFKCARSPKDTVIEVDGFDQ